MKAYNTKAIQIQLFQIRPLAAVLGADGASVKEYLTETKVLEDARGVRSSVSEARTIGEVLIALKGIEDRNERSRRISGVFNKFLSESPVGEAMGYDAEFGGVRISDEGVIKKGEYRSLLTAMIAQFRFDRFDASGQPVFTVAVKNSLFFSENLRAIDHEQFLNDRRTMYLPAFDRANKFNNILRSVASKPVYLYEEKTRKNPNPKRIGERFVAAGRMSQEEYDGLVKSQEPFPVCYVTGYSDYKKQYCYPSRDVEIIASDSLLKLRNSNPNIEFPEEIDEAINLYRHGKEKIREQMGEKTELLSVLQATLAEYFLFEDPISAECNSLQTPRFRVKRTKDRADVERGRAYYTDGVAGFGVNALCYPTTESFEEKEEKFLKFFSEKSKVTKLGLNFEKVSYSAAMAVKEPIKTAERIIEASGGCSSALVVWPNWPKLHNNKMLEFELMRRGVAVQNVVNENFQRDAPKISALMKGMAEKFPVDENVKMEEHDSIAPFDYALGLDVSRHGKKDVVSFPVVVDRFGRASCTLGDSLYTQDKEKRSVAEIGKVLKNVLAVNGEDGGRPVNILFLRDGIAYEDYDAVADDLPHNVTLTVVSVRKNLLNACSEDLPEGEFHSVFANHDADRFVFGLNARQGDKAKVTRLHMAQVMRNPLGLDNKTLGDILITLACQNKTTEMELGSLPFPISYADRTAGDIREIVDDTALCKHVKDNYPKEVDLAGGPSHFIYQEIKRFVETRPNGYAFAI